MGSHREKLVLGKNGSLGPKWTHLIRVTLEEEGGAEGGGWGGGFLAGGRFLHWREGGVGGWGGNEWSWWREWVFYGDDRGTNLDFCCWHFHSTVEMPFQSIDMWNECFTTQTPNC